MRTISVCMIVKDEEKVLGRVLEGAKQFADEIIVVDTGSTDNSKDIAHEFTNNVFDFEWCNDFAKARNFGIDKCTKDYFMWLDADDVIPKDTIDGLNKWKGGDENVDVVMMPYEMSFDKNGVAGFVYYRERILKNKAGFYFEGRVHECITPRGRIVYLEYPIQHKKVENKDPHRNIKIYEQMEKEKKQFCARENFYYANELFYLNNYTKAKKLYEKVLNDRTAYVENQIQACINLSIIYKGQNDTEKERQVLIKSFEYDLPRSEPLCKLANSYYEKKEYKKAIYWYNLALLSGSGKKHHGGFVYKDYLEYIPALMLGICHYHIGEIEKAIKYNEIALQCKPNDEKALSNKKFYLNKLCEKL